jgi:UDP-N-acetylglucosamine 2-epimerase (non-hydrolysing)
MLSGAEPETILRCVRTVLDQKPQWKAPPEYLIEDVSATVIKILLGFNNSSGRRAGNLS